MKVARKQRWLRKESSEFRRTAGRLRFGVICPCQEMKCVGWLPLSAANRPLSFSQLTRDSINHGAKAFSGVWSEADCQQGESSGGSRAKNWNLPRSEAEGCTFPAIGARLGRESTTMQSAGAFPDWYRWVQE